MDGELHYPERWWSFYERTGTCSKKNPKLHGIVKKKNGKTIKKEGELMQYTTTLPLQSGGRVTIPEHIRKKLGVKDGDLVVLIITTPEE